MARELKPCGTFAAYTRHKRRGETVDSACAQAARDQKNERMGRARDESAKVVQLAIAAEPVVEEVSELDDAKENLRLIRAAMTEAGARELSSLSKRRQELVAFISKLESQSKPGVSLLDQLAKQRQDRLSKAAN